jgi:methylmalonyl-CoA/ethylmalonyl-CoA epimerase
MLGSELAYVALAVRDVEATAHVLDRHLQLGRADLDSGAGDRVPVLSVGRSALALYPLGHAGIAGETRPGVHHIALGVRDLEAGIRAAREAQVPAGSTEVGLGGRRRVALDERATAHVKTFLIEPLDLEPGQSPLIERLDHVGVASADNATGIDAWARRLGCPIESQQTDMEVMIPVESFTSDKHGVVYHSRAPIPVAGLRVAFITVGDTDLEFLQNFDPGQAGQVEHGSAGTTRQDQGAIARYVATRGPGLHHIAFKTPDIDRVLRSLDQAGVPLIDKAGRPGSRVGRIGFMHPRGTGGVLMHFDQRPG